MVLEQPIIPFGEWLPGAAAVFLLLLLGIAIFAILGSFLVLVIRHGPKNALQHVARSIGNAWRDFRGISSRRIFAMARLAFKESLRRNVLIVFAVFAVLFLFAGWYLDVESDNPGRLYISFVMRTANLLVLLLAIFLSAFSLPADMKNKTIYTIVTKPVRAWEIIIGRILGFSAIGTGILALMCVFSYIFVVRGLDHEHEIVSASVQRQDNDEGWIGKTSRDSHHRHEMTLNRDGKGATDAVMGHYHIVAGEGSGESDDFRVSSPRGNLQARVPIYGDLTFTDRKGKPTAVGINVGKEWAYRGYIQGASLSTAIWHFHDLRSRDFLGKPGLKDDDGLPLEMTIRVFRTYTGDIERGILGSMEIVNPNPALKSSDPQVRAGLDRDIAVKSRSIPFTAQEFTPERRLIPRRIEAQMLDGTWREVDLFESLAHNGDLDIVVRCDERDQYFGMAMTDLYIRAADRWFWVNFAKSFVTLWYQMVIVTAFGVMFSTFLTGSVAMLSTLAVLVLGYFARDISRVSTGELEGGGPLESVVRIVKQENLVNPLDGGFTTSVIQAIDMVAMLALKGISFLMPNFRDFAEFGGINTARFVAYGFDIESNLMWQHAFTALGYVFLATCAGYFLLKSKEIAA